MPINRAAKRNAIKLLKTMQIKAMKLLKLIKQPLMMNYSGPLYVLVGTEQYPAESDPNKFSTYGARLDGCMKESCPAPFHVSKLDISCWPSKLPQAVARSGDVVFFFFKQPNVHEDLVYEFFARRGYLINVDDEIVKSAWSDLMHRVALSPSMPFHNSKFSANLITWTNRERYDLYEIEGKYITISVHWLNSDIPSDFPEHVRSLDNPKFMAKMALDVVECIAKGHDFSRGNRGNNPAE